MDNVSDALIIAGGVLLAMLAISLIVYTFGNVAHLESTKVEKAEIKDLAEWNAEWEAYNKKLLYGLEVITVCNKAGDNNAKYYNALEKKVTVTVLVDGQEINPSDINANSIYECVEMKYNPKTGRVNEIIFNFIK